MILVKKASYFIWQKSNDRIFAKMACIAMQWLRNFLPDAVWYAGPGTTQNTASAARKPRAPAAGVQLEEYDSDLLGTHRPTRMPPGLTQSPRREAPNRAGTCSVSPRVGPPATNEAPLARRTAAPPPQTSLNGLCGPEDSRA